MHGQIFAECSNLTSIELYNVISIGQSVFVDSCFKDISLPSSLTYMDYSAFNWQDNQYDYNTGKYEYTWQNNVPDLTAVRIHNKSLD